MGRPSNKDERREQIALAMKRVVAREGYDGASIALIAKEAGLASGLVHYHFADKLEILLSLHDLLAADVLDRIERAQQAKRTPTTRLEAVVDALLGTGPAADRELVACWVVVAAEAVRSKPVSERFGGTIAALLQTLATHLEPLVPDARRRAGIAAALVAAVQGYLQLAMAVPDAIPPGSAAPSVKRLLHALLAGEERAS